jgi:hypothetical protein
VVPFSMLLFQKLLLILFHFCIGKMMVTSSAGTSKGSSGKGVHTTESPLLQELLTDVEDALTHENSVLDIALALGHGGAINHDAVCGLLTE